MKRRSHVALLAALASIALTGSATAEPPQARSVDEAASFIDELLRDEKIDPRDVGIHPTDLAMMAGRRPRSGLVHLLMTEPLRADGFGRVVAERFTSAKTNVLLLSAMTRLNTRAVRRGLIGDPLAAQKQRAQKPDALRGILRELGATGVTQARLNSIPAAVRQAATVVLATIEGSEKWIARAMEREEDAFWKRLERELQKPLKTGPEAADDAEDVDFNIAYKRASERFESQFVMVAAQDLMFAVDEAVRILSEKPPADTDRFELRINSPRGWIILADGRGQRHAPDGPVLLIIDVGGDDEYAAAGSNHDREHPISVAIDIAGDDTYRAPDGAAGSFGAGLLGVGILSDVAGNDTYRGRRRSQAAGQFGVGVLIDAAGRDEYHAIDESQASATAGYGLLIDRGGKDRYESIRGSQGFAGVNAAAALVDLDGDDQYIARNDEILFPSPQSAQHNVSMCQGAASGNRADYIDGLSINGGVGLLLDAKGDDTYSCALFGQGVGYWYGAGMLIDLAGNDRYSGFWYVQGASAHFAAGLLFDRGGDDHYVCKRNMSQGAGHDIGIGVLIDDAGADEYEGSTLGLGASNAAGVGLFIDKAGDDTYQTPHGGCLGWVNPPDGYRSQFRCYGLFFDLGGRDVYSGLNDKPGRSQAANGKRWYAPPRSSEKGARSIGIAFDIE